MSTLSNSALDAGARPRHSLLIARWSAFVAALIAGICGPLFASDRIRSLAAERLQTEQEIELAALFGKWFAALSNTISLALLSLLVAGIVTLATRNTASERALTIRLVSQIILCVTLASVFLVGLM